MRKHRIKSDVPGNDSLDCMFSRASVQRDCYDRAFVRGKAGGN